MLIEFSLQLATASVRIEYALSAFETTTDAFIAGATPEVGVDEAGFYLAEDGLVHDAPNTDEWRHHRYDIRTSRALRGADRTLVIGIENQGANAMFVAAHWRLLVAYS